MADTSTPNWADLWAQWFPWTKWQDMPWGGDTMDLPTGDNAAKYQGWMNTFLPWIQAGMQGEQWGQTFDWTKQADLWSQAFQESQFGWTKEMDEWNKQYQEKQLAEQAQQANLEAFGRRWKPSTRWT